MYDSNLRKKLNQLAHEYGKGLSIDFLSVETTSENVVIFKDTSLNFNRNSWVNS